MDILQSITLGLIQGLTEFLPISSSGHLIVVRELLGLPLVNTLTFDVLLHLATLFAIIVFFWGYIKRIFIDFKTEGPSTRSKHLVWALIIATIPVGLAGYFGAEWFEETFRDPAHVAYALIAGSIVFFLADKAHKWGQHGGLTWPRSFAIGVFQALALIPGVSRSGITISGGLFAGLSREEAIRFAFLLGIPTISGAVLKTILDSSSFLFADLSIFTSFNLLIAFLTAFFSGLWAVRFLVRYLAKHPFTPFIIYRLVLAAIILILI